VGDRQGLISVSTCRFETSNVEYAVGAAPFPKVGSAVELDGKETAMPIVTIQVIEDVFTDDQRTR
jgi:hypothetical protein